MAWEFLRRGVSYSHAVQTLDRLAVDLGNVLSNSTDRPTDDAARYMMWVEQAEGTLASLYSTREVANGLQTDRYWRIRSISADTERPTPMIRAECDLQAQRLRELEGQLNHFAKALKLEDDESFLLLDSNVWMHGKLFIEIPWAEMVTTKRVVLLLPVVVVDELDKQKDLGRGSSAKARSALREIQRLAHGQFGNDSIAVRTDVALRLLNEPRHHLRLPREDDEIMRQAEYYAAISNDRVTMVSRDNGMSIRAAYSFVPLTMLPAKYERSQTGENETI